MKKTSRAALPLLLCCFLAQPARALDSFTVENKFPGKIYVAISWYDDNSSRWITKGWAALERGAKTVYHLNTSVNTVYYYAEQQADLRGKFDVWNGDGQKGSQWRLVRSEGFSYTEDQSCPQGKRRAVIFRELNCGSVKNYTLSLTKGK